MSLVKKFVLVSCVAVAVFGLFQAQGSAALISEWLLNENPLPYGATIADTTAAHNMSVLTEASPTSIDNPTSVAGRWGVANTALHFDGNDGLATNASFSGTTANWLVYYKTSFTVEAFFKRDTTTNTDAFIYADSAWGTPFDLLRVSGNKIQFGVLDTAGWGSLTTLATTALQADKWYYVAGVLNSNVPTIYLYDGANWDTVTGTAAGARRPDSSAGGGGYSAQIGAGITRTNSATIPGWVGTLDNVRLWDTALDMQTLIAHATTNTDIPEPSTLVLLAAGLAGLLAYAWRKHK